MWNTLKSFLESKKAIAAIVGLVLTAYGQKLGIPAERTDSIIKLVLVYMGAQGIADFQKSATLAKISADTAAAPKKP